MKKNNKFSMKRLIIDIIGLLVIFIAFFRISSAETFYETETKHFKVVMSNGIRELPDIYLYKFLDEAYEKLTKYYEIEPKDKLALFVVDLDGKEVQFSEDRIVINLGENNLRKFNAYDGKILDYITYYEIARYFLFLKFSSSIPGFFKMLNTVYPVKEKAELISIPTWFIKGASLYATSKVINDINSIFSFDLKRRVIEALSSAATIKNEKNVKNSELFPYVKYDDFLLSYLFYSFLEYFEATYGPKKLKIAIDAYFNTMNSKESIRANKIFDGPFFTFAKLLNISQERLMDDWYSWADKKYTKEKKLNLFGDYRVTENVSMNDNDIYRLNFNVVTGESKLLYIGIDSAIKGKFEFNEYKTFDDIRWFSLGKVIYYTTLRGNEYVIHTKSPFKKVVNGPKFAVTELGKIYVKSRGLVDSLYIEEEQLLGHDKGLKFQKLFYTKGNLLYFSAIRYGEPEPSLYLFNIKERKLTRLTKGMSPFVLENRLYYSAKDDLGTPNIYLMDLITKKEFKLTDTKIGAYEPLVFRKGSDLFLYYITSAEPNGTIKRINLNEIFKESGISEEIKRYEKYSFTAAKGVAEKSQLTLYDKHNHLLYPHIDLFMREVGVCYSYLHDEIVFNEDIVNIRLYHSFFPTKFQPKLLMFNNIPIFNGVRWSAFLNLDLLTDFFISEKKIEEIEKYRGEKYYLKAGPQLKNEMIDLYITGRLSLDRGTIGLPGIIAGFDTKYFLTEYYFGKDNNEFCSQLNRDLNVVDSSHYLIAGIKLEGKIESSPTIVNYKIKGNAIKGKMHLYFGKDFDALKKGLNILILSPELGYEFYLYYLKVFLALGFHLNVLGIESANLIKSLKDSMIVYPQFKVEF